MFIKWSIFGFLLKRPNIDNRHKQSVLDDMFNIYKNTDSATQVPSNSTVSLNIGYRTIGFERQGLDERYPPIEPDQNDTLFKINTYFKKQLILNYLMNSNNSIYDKLETIERNKDEYDFLPNITKGGLMKDWDFVF